MSAQRTNIIKWGLKCSTKHDDTCDILSNPIYEPYLFQFTKLSFYMENKIIMSTVNIYSTEFTVSNST